MEYFSRTLGNNPATILRQIPFFVEKFLLFWHLVYIIASFFIFYTLFRYRFPHVNSQRLIGIIVLLMKHTFLITCPRRNVSILKQTFKLFKDNKFYSQIIYKHDLHFFDKNYIVWQAFVNFDLILQEERFYKNFTTALTVLLILIIFNNTEIHY